MNRDELKKLIVGPIATVPTPFDKDFEVDYGRMYELTQGWVENGLVKGKAVIKVAAAMGEGPMLRDDEWPYLLRTVVQAANGRAAVVCGLHYKDTKRTIEDAKRAQDMGAIALQVCPPIFNLPSQNDLLDYYSELSDAIDIGIMVYHTHWMPGGRIEIDTIMKMADIEQVASIKWSCPTDVDNDEIAKFTPIFNVIANGNAIRCHQLGARGYINLTAESYPPHDLKLWELLESKQYAEAEALNERVDKPLREFLGKVDARSGGQARVKKGIMALMGQPVGASRPPSKPLNEEELEELRQILLGFGWPVQATVQAALAA
jgi:dihydrodipicolinate synthase/N-acetylneuraminate lyase